MAIDPVTGAVMSNRATVEGWLDGLLMDSLMISEEHDQEAREFRYEAARALVEELAPEGAAERVLAVHFAAAQAAALEWQGRAVSRYLPEKTRETAQRFANSLYTIVKGQAATLARLKETRRKAETAARAEARDLGRDRGARRGARPETAPGVGRDGTPGGRGPGRVLPRHVAGRRRSRQPLGQRRGGRPDAGARGGACRRERDRGRHWGLRGARRPGARYRPREPAPPAAPRGLEAPQEARQAERAGAVTGGP
jgi:hypothetical protein